MPPHAIGPAPDQPKTTDSLLVNHLARQKPHPRMQRASHLPANEQFLGQNPLDRRNFPSCSGLNLLGALRGDLIFSALPPKPAPSIPRDRRLFCARRARPAATSQRILFQLVQPKIPERNLITFRLEPDIALGLPDLGRIRHLAVHGQCARVAHITARSAASPSSARSPSPRTG